MLPLITLEEHYVSSKVREMQTVDRYASFPQQLVAKLMSLGNERIRDMDSGKVSLQVILHGPGIRPPTLCAAANDELAWSISKNSDRMAGFAMLPMDQPEAAAKELERCVYDLHFVGAFVDSHVNGQMYDDGRFGLSSRKRRNWTSRCIFTHHSQPTMNTIRGTTMTQLLWHWVRLDGDGIQKRH
jgi:predicted TIM-barrel fold metal-dependent hydrolase